MYLNELVENRVFVDLLAVVRNSLQAGLESLSLKFMEQVAGFDRSADQQGIDSGDGNTNGPSLDPESDGTIQQGAGAVFEYELANHALYGISRDEDRKRAIAKYKEDVDATQLLHAWLLEQRSETEAFEYEVLSRIRYFLASSRVAGKKYWNRCVTKCL